MISAHQKTAFFAFVSFILSAVVFRPATLRAAPGTEILTSPWTLTGQNGAAERYQSVDPNILTDKQSLRLALNLHGTCLYGGDASAVVFDQPRGGDWRYVSLSDYVDNCSSAPQVVDIPLSDFLNLDPDKPIGLFHIRLWHPDYFSVDVSSAQLISSDAPIATPVPDPKPQPSPVPQDGYLIEFWNLSANSAFTIPDRSADASRHDNSLNFDWGSASPASGIDSDYFIARFQSVPDLTAGDYRYTVVSDDGVRLWIDNRLVLDNWTDHPATTDSGDLSLAAGTHQIRLEFYEKTGNAVFKFSLDPVSSTQPSPTPTNPSVGQTWTIQSVSSMKETKDKICGQDPRQFIENWVDKAKELGVNYVAVETPYDNPGCGDALSYTQAWVDVIRSRGLKVWHRHMFLAFEGIYDTPKNNRLDYLARTRDYIRAHPSLFAPGDIFTPAPEPQNGGISGFSYCSQGVCQFSSISHFNRWLRDAIDVSRQAFGEIGLGDQVEVGYYGFDGFVAWGSNNPDWNGILEDSTIEKMGNITIDHYPELIGQTMDQGLDELQARYPNVPIIIGEWGSAGSSSVEQQVKDSMAAAARPGVVGFNYWHMGMGGNEALIDDNFNNRPQYDEVAAFFHGQRP